ncbi:hypothetical protein V6N13_014069 [Hibiscus sabdariffa]
MRDLCLSKAKQENFIFVVDQSNASSLSSIQRARRVYAHDVFQINCIKSPMLRSLLFFDGYPTLDDALFQKLDGYFDRYQDNHIVLFAVLVVSLFGMHLKLKRIWKHMLNNFKLLRGSWPPKVEAAIIFGELEVLADLGFKGYTTDSGHVPNVIWRMEQLRHLYLPYKCDRKTKLKLGTLRNLQTLVNFNTKNCYLKDLINMTNIRVLVIRGPFQIKDFNADDSYKNPPIIEGRYLHSLSIFNDKGRIDPRHLKHLLSSCVSVCKLTLGVEISELPEYLNSSSNLAYLNLRMCKLEDDPMPTPEKLPSLRALDLIFLAFKGKEMCCSTQGFPKLEYLRIGGVEGG